MGRLRTPRRSQPQQLVGLDPSNKYSKRVIDGFFGTSGLTLRGKVITDSANITKTVSSAGKVRRGAANAGFSFPCDLTGNNGITIVFQYVQYSRSGTQVLFEHSVDQNTNAGTFIVYTDATASKLAFGTSAGGNYDAGTVALPALGDVVTVAVRLRFTASVSASDDIKIWINGVSPAFTSAATTSYAGNFGNYTTYFLSRAASSLQADASASMYAVLSGFASDAELRELSLNPWQLFTPVARSIWVPVAAGGGSTGTLATTNANDTSAASGTTTVTGSLANTNANDTSSASGTTTVTGSLAKTNSSDTASASGTTTVIGTLAKTNANDACVASGEVGGESTGTVAYTNANDTAAASGWSGTITGTLAYTNNNDTSAASGVSVTGGGLKRYKHYRKGYLKRGNEVLVFDSEELAEQYEAAEIEANQAINRAQRRKARIAIPKPAAKLDIAQVEIQAAAYEIPANVPNMVAALDYEQLVMLTQRIADMQEEEDLELLLL